MKRHRSHTEAVLMSFGSEVSLPKNYITLTSQCLAATDNMLLRPAESAGQIPISNLKVITFKTVRRLTKERNLHARIACFIPTQDYGYDFKPQTCTANNKTERCGV